MSQHSVPNSQKSIKSKIMPVKLDIKEIFTKKNFTQFTVLWRYFNKVPKVLCLSLFALPKFPINLKIQKLSNFWSGKNVQSICFGGWRSPRVNKLLNETKWKLFYILQQFYEHFSYSSSYSVLYMASAWNAWNEQSPI